MPVNPNHRSPRQAQRQRPARRVRDDSPRRICSSAGDLPRGSQLAPFSGQANLTQDLTHEPRREKARDRNGYSRAVALLAQLVEHLHGKEGVSGSSPEEGFSAPASLDGRGCTNRVRLVGLSLGFSETPSVTISGKTIPEVDANYQAPTPINSGHGLPGQPNFADGLFTKPAIGSYPAYLNQPQFCGPAITAGSSCATIQYKSGTRAYIESQGYDIVANFGDQFSDLLGGFGDKTFKMPNPNYYLP